MVVCWGGVVKGGEDCGYGVRQNSCDVNVAEEDIGAVVVDLSAFEADFWLWESWGLWMWS